MLSALALIHECHLERELHPWYDDVGKYAYQVALHWLFSMHSGPPQIHVLPLLYCADDFVISTSPLAHLSSTCCRGECLSWNELDKRSYFRKCDLTMSTNLLAHVIHLPSWHNVVCAMLVSWECIWQQGRCVFGCPRPLVVKALPAKISAKLW